jgi:hypothetical protein
MSARTHTHTHKHKHQQHNHKRKQGVDGEEAKKRIEDDLPGLKVQILPQVREQGMD